MAVLTLWGMARVELQLLPHIELEWTKEMPQLRTEEVVSQSGRIHRDNRATANQRGRAR